MAHIASTVEDWVRVIGSAKVTYILRQKAFEELNKLEVKLNKGRESYSNLVKDQKLRQDKITKAIQSSSKVYIIKLILG